MVYKAILFDFEGTLVDFQWKMDDACEEVLKALSTFGFDAGTFSGCNYATLYNKAVEEAGRLSLQVERVKKEIEEVFDRYDMDALSRWTLRADARAVLCTLIDGGILTGLVTNAGYKAVSILLHRLDLTHMFHSVITRNSVERMKPKGEGIHRVLDALKVGVREVLFVGDSVTDILASQEVGVDSAIVLGGESLIEEIEAHHPNFIIEELSEILFKILATDSR